MQSHVRLLVSLLCWCALLACWYSCTHASAFPVVRSLPDLTEPIDVYAEWIDACEAARETAVNP